MVTTKPCGNLSQKSGGDEGAPILISIVSEWDVHLAYIGVMVRCPPTFDHIKFVITFFEMKPKNITLDLVYMLT